MIITAFYHLLIVFTSFQLIDYTLQIPPFFPIRYLSLILILNTSDNDKKQP